MVVGVNPCESRTLLGNFERHDTKYCIMSFFVYYLLPFLSYICHNLELTSYFLSNFHEILAIDMYVNIEEIFNGGTRSWQ